MKKIFIFIILLFLLGCDNDKKNYLKINWKLGVYESEKVINNINFLKDTDIICFGDYLYKERYKIKNPLNFKNHQYTYNEGKLYRSEYSFLKNPYGKKLNNMYLNKEDYIECMGDFLIKGKILEINSKKEKIIKKYNNLKKIKKMKKDYSLEELENIFIRSGYFCRGDLLYKGNKRFKPNKKKYSQYFELREKKSIYGDENPLDFMARYNLYCMGEFNLNGGVVDNIFKKQILSKFYSNIKGNEQNYKAKEIFLRDLKKGKKISIEELKFLFNYLDKIPTLYEEITEINYLSDIYNLLDTEEKKKFFIKLIDKILKVTESSNTFAFVFEFYKRNNLLDKKRIFLKNKLEKEEYSDNFDKGNIEGLKKMLFTSP